MNSLALPGIQPELPAALGPAIAPSLPQCHGNGDRGQQPAPEQGASDKTSGKLFVFSRLPPPQWGDWIFPPLPHWGGLDLNSNSSGCACLGSGVVPPLGVVEKEVAVLIDLVRRRRCAVGAVVRRVVDDEVPGAVEEEAGPAAVRGCGSRS